MRRRLLLFTDLDGTLMHPVTYEYDAAIPVIQELARQGHWVIPTTSKTRREVEAFVKRVGALGAFVVENGSAVFIPPTSPLFDRVELPREDGYGVRILGVRHEEALQALRKIREEVGEDALKPLSEMDDEEVVRLTGLPREKIPAMRAREFSEPFVILKPHLRPVIASRAEARGFRILRGDRFDHIIGIRAGKGEAVRCLVETFSRVYPEVTWVTAGLGNAPNDLSLLEAVDHPMVIGNHPLLVERGFPRVETPPPEGWVEGVRRILNATGEDR